MKDIRVYIFSYLQITQNKNTATYAAVFLLQENNQAF